MKKVKVSGETPYEIIIEKGALNKVCDYAGFLSFKKVMIVTDETVAPLYLSAVKTSLESAGKICHETILPQGEEHKTPKSYLQIIDALAERGFTRKDLVLALGGGVVSDIAGFAAATYMRGIDFIVCPTTLLSAIDASVGGKTGVDLKQGKNLLGAFHAPRLVLIDINSFKTLSESEIKNGMGEGIKYAVLTGGELSKMVEVGIKDLERFIELCVSYKKDIVERDFKESGDRKLLNLGHTFAHAAEKLSNYTLPHGIAVAKGLMSVSEYAYRTNKLSFKDKEKIKNMIKAAGIDETMPYKINELAFVMRMDKKADSDGEVSLVVPYSVGECKIEKTSIDKIVEVLK